MTAELTGKETPAIEGPTPTLTAQQGAALAAAVTRIACQVTGSGFGDPEMALTRLGLTPAERKAILSVTAP